MTEATASVKITGDATQATAATKESAAAVESAFALMKEKLLELGASFRTTFVGIGESANMGATAVQAASTKVVGATEVMKGAGERLKGHWEGVSGAMSKVNGIVAGLFAVLAGGEMFEKAIEATTTYTGEVNRLSKAFGITLHQADGFHAALSKLGLQTDTMTTLGGKLVRQLRGHEDAFNRLGIVTRDSEGHFRNLQDVMLDGLDKLRGYQEGIDRTAASQVLFGRGAGDLTALLRLNREELEEGAKTARELGLVTTEEGVRANREYQQSVRELHEVWEAFQIAIGRELLPLLTELAQWFRSEGPAAIHQTTSAIGDLTNTAKSLPADWNLVTTAVTSSLAGWKAGFDKINLWIDTLEAKIQLFGVVSAMALSGHVGEAVDVWKAGLAQIAAEADRESARIVGAANRAISAWDRAKWEMGAAGQDLGGWMSGDKADPGYHSDFLDGPPPPPEPHGGGRLDDIKQGHGSKEKQKKEKDDLVQHLEEQLKARQVAFALEQDAQGQAQEYSLQSVSDYWKQALSLHDLSEKDKLAIEERYLAAHKQLTEDQIQQTVADYRKQLDEAKGDTAARLKIAQGEADFLGRMYGQNSKQFKAAEDQIVNLRREAVEQQKRLEDQLIQHVEKLRLGEIDAAEAAGRYRVEMGFITSGDLLAQERDFENRRFDIQRNGLQQRRGLLDPGRDKEQYARISQQIEELEQQHQQRVTQIDRQATLSRTAFTRQEISSFSSAWGQAFGRLVTLQAGLANTMKSLWQGVANLISDVLSHMIEKYLAHWLTMMAVKMGLMKVEHAQTVIGEAGLAGAGGVASMAAAPFPLNLTAPAFGASMMAAAMAYAPMASAAGGYDIPSGVNPIVQAHAKEMVLPERFANVIRGMAEGGGGGGRQFHYHDHTGRLTPDMIRANKSAFVKMIQEAERDFSLVPRRR